MVVLAIVLGQYMLDVLLITTVIVDMLLLETISKGHVSMVVSGMEELLFA